jgi:hypothetical protein
MIQLIGHREVMKAINYELLQRRYELYTLNELEAIYLIKKNRTVNKINDFSKKVENINKYNFAHDFYSGIRNVKSKDIKVLKSRYISALIVILATNYFIDYYSDRLEIENSSPKLSQTSKTKANEKEPR